MLSLALAGALMLPGCGPAKQPPLPAPDPAPKAATAPGGGYLGTVSGAKPAAQKTLAAAHIKQAIQGFYAAEGRYPRNLNELVPDYLPAVPNVPAGITMKYSPDTGEVTVTKQ